MKPSMGLVVAVALLALGTILVACRARPKYVEGGIYSIPVEHGRYGVIKILKVDEGGVHIRVYSNVFPQRPGTVDSSKFYMSGMEPKPTEQMGIGHSAISHATFRGWGAEFIKREPVRNDELEGYRMWKEQKGGYF